MRTLYFFLASFLLFFNCQTENYSGISQNPVIVHTKALNSKYVHMPDIEVMDKENIIIVWREEQKGASDFGDILYSVSNNGGADL